ncbi:CUE domain-containing protein 2 [Rhinoraja longicauda]
MALEKLIHDSLTKFVHSYIPDADLSVIDEVILSYITGVLEELGSPDSSEENFDVEMFVEMMEAKISSITIYEMMFDLAAQLIEARNKENIPPPSPSLQDTVCSLKKQSSDWEQRSSMELEINLVAGVGAMAKKGCDKKEDGVQLLLEMFPSCSVSAMQHVLSMAKGDLHYAVQLIMEGAVEEPDTAPSEVMPKTDKKIKASILEKYMMVDDEEDVKTHKPIAPKAAPKKLIRYIDNQVVSTKGERYTEVKKTENDEMKKTYINLKPARKYKFH